jgi:phenylacetate-coenzyme A ligase PaaK-like adenylate-forming protein
MSLTDAGIFDTNEQDFVDKALETFRFQCSGNPVYHRYAEALGVLPGDVKILMDIPFLPVSLFKTHAVCTGAFDPEVVFESSGTTGTVPSRHLVRSLALYRQSFTRGFRLFYGEPGDWCVIGLLPSYLERSHSSLVVMVDELIRLSGHPDSGFYLYQYDALRSVLQRLETSGQKTLLIGVSFALLDLAEQFPMNLRHTIVMETGGMKGRKEEMTREALNERLCAGLGVDRIHSEYGMTELLSQAYSAGKGLFRCPPWMRIMLRSEDDPFCYTDVDGLPLTQGLISVIDLANRYSCAFIATDDLGRMHADGSFAVLGRTDHSDVRGCSLLVSG